MILAALIPSPSVAARTARVGIAEMTATDTTAAGDFKVKVSFSNGKVLLLLPRPVSRWAHLLKKGAWTRYGISAQDSEVFVSGSLTSAAYCYSLDLQGYRASNRGYGAASILNRAMQHIEVYHVGWKGFKEFGPASVQSRLLGKIRQGASGAAHRIRPCSVSLSPNGDFVVVQWTFAKTSELWEMNILTGAQKKLWTGRWSPRDDLPKFAFHWTKGGFYWTPRPVGPLEFVSNQGKIFKAANVAPYRFDLKRRLAFFLTDWHKASQVTNDDWVDNIAARLIARRMIVRGHRVAYSKRIWTSRFWVFPGMPEFLVSPVKSGWYFVFGDFRNSYFVNPEKSEMADTGGQMKEVHFATSEHLVTGANIGTTRGWSLYLQMHRYSWSGRTILADKDARQIDLLHRNGGQMSLLLMLEVDRQPLGTFYAVQGDLNETPYSQINWYYRAFPCASNDVSRFPVLDDFFAYAQGGALMPP